MSDIRRKRGDTYADEFTVKSASTSLPITITGYTFLMTLDARQYPSNTDTQLYQLSGIIIDDAAGRVEFAPSEIQADNLGEYFYDVQMIDVAGRKRTIQSGIYNFVQDITKV